MFALQLTLNAAWSALFFGAHAMGWALAEIVVLWLCIAKRLGFPRGVTTMIPAWLAVAHRQQ